MHPRRGTVLRSLFHRSAWKGNSAKLNFRFTEFSEVHLPFDTKVLKIRRLRDARSLSQE